MVGAGFEGERQIGAEEGCAKLGYQLFSGITLPQLWIRGEGIPKGCRD